MTITKISDLPASSGLLDATILPVVDTGTTKKIIGSQIKSYVLSSVDSITFSADSTVQTTAWNDAAFMASMISYDGPIVTNTATIGVGGLTVNGPVTFNGAFTYISTATTQVTGSTGTFYGDVYGVGALYAGVAGYSPLPATVIQSSANVNDYIQNNFQNINNGVTASTEWVATADNGNDSNNYLDMGVAGGAWNGTQANSVGTAAQANDSWVYAQGTTSSSAGGNLILGTIKNGKSVKILTGSTGSSSIVATFNGRNQSATSTSTGALQVIGGIAASGASYFGSNVTANKFYGDGSSLTNITLSLASSILGTGTNVSLVAGSYTYTFDNTGTFTMPVNGDIVMTGTNSILSVSGTTLLGGAAQVVGYYSTLGVKYPGGSTQYGMTLRPAADNTNAITFLNAAGTNIGSITQTTSTVLFNMPNRPAFRVYGAGTTSGLTTTQNTTGILNGNNFAVDYQQGTALSTSTGVFTAPVAGLYSIHLVARVTNNTAPAAQVCVIKNYATSAVNQVFWETGANPSINHFGVSTIANLAVGDTLVVKVTQGSITFDINDSWAVAYIG